MVVLVVLATVVDVGATVVDGGVDDDVVVAVGSSSPCVAMRMPRTSATTPTRDPTTRMTRFWLVTRCGSTATSSPVRRGVTGHP